MIVVGTAGFRQLAEQERDRRAYEAIVAAQEKRQREDEAWLDSCAPEGYGAYVNAQGAFGGLSALVRVFKRLGAEPYDKDAQIAHPASAAFCAAARRMWFGVAYGYNRDEAVWVLRVLENSGYRIDTTAERLAWDAFPAEVPLWRGFHCLPHHDASDIDRIARGHSWSLKRSIAVAYSGCAGENTRVGQVRSHLVRALVPKELIYGYFAGGSQEVVVLWPERIVTLSVERLEYRPAE